MYKIFSAAQESWAEMTHRAWGSRPLSTQCARPAAPRPPAPAGAPPPARRTLLPVLAALAALLALAGCRFSIDYHRYAVVYGVANYTALDPQYDLTYTYDDAVDMNTLLASQGFTVIQRLNGEVTRDHLEADFAGFAAQAGPDDLFLFYFTGHGGAVDAAGNPLPYPLPEGVTPAAEVIYLDADTAPNPMTSPYPMTSSELAVRLADIPARKRVVIIDACNSGGFIGNRLEGDRLPPDYLGGEQPLFGVLGKAISLYANFGQSGGDIPPSLALVMAAAGEREVSWETGYPWEHGIFTYFLLKAPAQADGNRDGFVTVSETYGYVRDAIEKEWNSVPSGIDSIFAPRVSGGPVDFVLFEAR